MTYIDNCSVEILTNSIQLLNLSDEEYFSDIYANYTSNSRLKLINPLEGGSPKKYFNPPKQDYSKNLEFGSAIHAKILQPSKFEIIADYQHKPGGKLGVFIEKVVYYRKLHYPIYKALLQASEDTNYYVGKLKGRILQNTIKSGLRYYLDYYYNIFNLDNNKTPIVLSPSALISVQDCLQRYENSSICSFLNKQNITGSKEFFFEQTILLHIKVTLPTKQSVIIPFKLKIDNYTIDNDEGIITLNDLKTTGINIQYFMGQKTWNEKTEEFEGFLGSFQVYHYYRQMAVYLYVLQLLYGPKYTYQANILAIESSGMYNSSIFPISDAYIKKGIDEFKELMCRVAFHTINGINKQFDYDT